jgi:hypothetical protein
MTVLPLSCRSELQIYDFCLRQPVGIARCFAAVSGFKLLRHSGFTLLFLSRSERVHRMQRGVPTLKGSLTRESVRMALRAVLVLAGLFAFVAAGVAQREAAISELGALPEGVTLPVQLGRSLRAGKVRVGTQIVVKTTQRVPVSENFYLKAGAELDGEVVASVAGSGNASRPATLSIRFTRLRYGNQSIPLRTKAIAIANFMQVGYAGLPADGGPDMGITNAANWTTKQVGGDAVVRTGWVGPVVGSDTQTVGHADYYGVYSLPAPSPGDGPSFPRALGVFSTTAAGLYGFGPGSALKSDDGTITLTGPGKSVGLRNGDNLLLEVLAPS